MKPRTLTHLVEAAAAGDDEAWIVLVDRFGRLLEATARSYRLNEHDAQDVAQTTWLRLIESIEKLRTPDALGGWLSITARRESLRTVKANVRETPTEDAGMSEPAATPLPEARMIAEERRRVVQRAIAALPPRSRTLLTMLMLDPPPSYDEIADVTGMPIGSIGPTRGRCLDRLRRDEHIAAAA